MSSPSVAKNKLLFILKIYRDDFTIRSKRSEIEWKKEENNNYIFQL